MLTPMPPVRLSIYIWYFDYVNFDNDETMRPQETTALTWYVIALTVRLHVVSQTADTLFYF